MDTDAEITAVSEVGMRLQMAEDLRERAGELEQTIGDELKPMLGRKVRVKIAGDPEDSPSDQTLLEHFSTRRVGRDVVFSTAYNALWRVLRRSVLIDFSVEDGEATVTIREISLYTIEHRVDLKYFDIELAE